jgi:hypothetical protein
MMELGNRVLWSLVAAALLAVGIAGLLAGSGVIGMSAQHTTLLPQAGVHLWQQGGIGALVGLSAVGAVLSLCGAMLVRAQLRTAGPAMADLVVPSRSDGARAERGRTAVSGGTIATGFQRDLRRIPSVQGARVRMSGDVARPLVRARIDVVAGADLQDLREEVRQSIARLAATSGAAPVALDVTLRLRAQRD